MGIRHHQESTNPFKVPWGEAICLWCRQQICAWIDNPHIHLYEGMSLMLNCCTSAVHQKKEKGKQQWKLLNHFFFLTRQLYICRWQKLFEDLRNESVLGLSFQPQDPRLSDGPQNSHRWSKMKSCSIYDNNTSRFPGSEIARISKALLLSLMKHSRKLILLA